MKKRNYLLLSFLFATASLFAQVGSLPILNSNTDARLAALGNANSALYSTMSIYQNPASILLADEKFNLGISSELFPETSFGRTMQYNTALGYTFHKRHALLGGFRLMTGCKKGDTPENFAYPKDFTIDLGYAFRLNKNISLHALATYLNKEKGEGNGFAISAGANYNREFKMFKRETTFNLGLNLANFGQDIVMNDTKERIELPSSVSLGAELLTQVAPKHEVGLLAGARCFISSEKANVNANVGAEYEYNDLVAARVGYSYSKNYADFLTLGAGVNVWRMTLDFTYLKPIKKENAGERFMLGLSYYL